MTFEQVDNELQKVFDRATKEGKDSMVLVSKDFFEMMEIKPDYGDCIPMCCNVMKKNLNEKIDKVIYHTPSWQSHTLTIEYALPR